MVSEREHKGEKIYTCDICGFGYRERERAESCEEYCAEFQSCNIEITKNAVYFPESNET